MARPAGSGVINGVGFHVVTQTNGPGVGVFSVASLKVETGIKVTIVGGNAFALASVLTLLALVTLILKVGVEHKARRDLARAARIEAEGKKS